MKPAWYNKKWAIILLHTFSWLAIFTIPFLMRTSAGNNSGNNDQLKKFLEGSFIYFYFITSCLWVLFFYLNAFFLFPTFIAKKKIWQYVGAQVLFILVLSGLHSLFFNILVKESPYDLRNFFIFNTFPYLFILASSTAYRMILDKVKADQLLQSKENENLKTELSFLRSQVSPHFMFNVLNNMVALARKQSDQLEPSLIKLSSLMRYMLYETDDDKVLLEKEIDYVKSYIDLQQLRFGKNLTVNVNMQEIDGGYEIEPMLLIPFVENAFKHGTGLIENPQIDIQLEVKNDMLHFTARNKYKDDTAEIKDKTSGIGLNNVRRRLNLLYGTNHSLLINKKDCWFTVSLQLNLH